jgi:hypothetical protein
MSDMCFWDLTIRGDEVAISYVLDDRPSKDDHGYVAYAGDQLRSFPSPAVALALRQRLTAARDSSQKVRMLGLFGRFGDDSDEAIIRPYLDDPDDTVANVACEALLRLTDPLLVPSYWREI